MPKHGFLSYWIFITEFHSSLFEFQLTPLLFKSLQPSLNFIYLSLKGSCGSLKVIDFFKMKSLKKFFY